jgi:multiple sugar transport system permease protein
VGRRRRRRPAAAGRRLEPYRGREAVIAQTSAGGAMRRTRIDDPEARRFLWICLVPVILFLALVSLAPFVVALIDSMREMSLSALFDRGQFIGLKNFRAALGDDTELYHAVGLTALFVAVVVPVEFVLGLALALVLDRDFRARRVWVTVLLLPAMLAPVVVGMIWRFLLMPSFGLLTYYMNKMGWFSEVPIFSNELTAFLGIVVVDIWEWTPFMMLFMLAGLVSMPRDPIEAAEIDGASRWQILRHVQLPLLRPMIILAVLFRSIDASKVFDIVHVLTEGGPGTATETVSVYAYRSSFVQWDLGVGAAVCLVIAYLSILVASVFYKIVSRQTATERAV